MSAAPLAPCGAGGAEAFSLRPSVEPFAAEDGHIYVMKGGARADFVIRNADDRVRALLAALDGSPLTLDEIVIRLDAAGTSATRAQIVALLSQLRACDLLHETGASSVDPAVAERFARQCAWLADRLGTDREVSSAQLRLTQARIGILGCGGLGSWTAIALACIGVGALVLVDDDTVELSNLNRQILFGVDDIGEPKVLAAAEALRRFDPAIAVETHVARLSTIDAVSDVIAGCDFVVEAADWPMYELPRWVDAACRRHGIPHISGAQHPPLIRVGPTRIPGRSPCLACIEAHAREAYPMYDEIATFRAGRDRATPTLGPASGVIGALMATEILNALTGVHEPATLNRSLVLRLDTFETRLVPEPLSECEHGRGR
jgi:molybdopterin-synthase adenylyltransferase